MPFRHVFLVFLILFLVVLYLNQVFVYQKYLHVKNSLWNVTKDVRRIKNSPSIYLRQVVRTHIGEVSIIELREEVFKDYGYNLTVPTHPFVTLELANPVDCKWEFDEYLILYENDKKHNRRPKAFIPDDSTREFLLNKYTALSYKYSDDRSNLNVTFKSWDNIADIATWHARDVLRLVDDNSRLSMHYAMQSYRITGKRGLILAGEHPIVEVQAIQNGASRILSIGRVAHENDDISSMTIAEFAENNQRYTNSFDFIATSSTLETFGLGRFGEVLDSSGDIRMMMLLGCSLKKRGLFFLEIPIGRDALIFNINRIYGHARLPMLIAGFEWIATFSEDSPYPTEITARDIDKLRKFESFKRTLVLRKL